jgi:hypothetical protein
VNNLLVQIDTSATSSYTHVYTNIVIYFISTTYTTTTMHTHISFSIQFRWSIIMFILSLSTASSGTAWTVVGGKGIGGICYIMSSHWKNWQPPAWNTRLTTLSHSTTKHTKTYMYMIGCLPKSRGTCRTRDEGSLVWLLGSSWWGHGNSGNILSLGVEQSLLCCLSFETWLLPKGRQREGEGDIMDGYFYMAPN